MLISAAGPVTSAMPTPTLYSAAAICEVRRRAKTAVLSMRPMMMSVRLRHLSSPQ